MSRRGSSALAAFLLCVSCGGFDERPTQVQFDPSAREFWARPFPSDLRRQEDGSFDLERWPAYGADDPRAIGNTLLADWLVTLDERVRDGFSVSMGGYFAMSGPLDSALIGTAEESLTDGAKAFLIDIDPGSPDRGKRLPVELAVRAGGDRYAPPNLISVVPPFGFLKRPKTEYAFVLTDAILDDSGEPIGRSAAFHEAFTEGDADADVIEHFHDLHHTLEEAGTDPDSVVGAAVFTTMDPNQRLFDLAAWAETQPIPALQPFRVAETYPDYQVLTSTFTVPVIQSGRRPYKEHGEGRIVFGDDGKPVIQSTQNVRLVITIPRRAQPAAGFPLVMYLHGSGGEWYEGIDRGKLPQVGERGSLPDPEKGTGPAQWLARRGIGMAGFDFPIHGNRNNPPDTTGLVFYNLFGNVDATIDNFHVAEMELILIARLLLSMELDPAISPNLNAGGQAAIKLDPDRFAAMGQSMGQSLGIPWSTVDRRIKAFFASGSGGMLPEIAVNALEPITLRTFVEGAAELPMDQHLDVNHPLLHALQTLWDLVDPVVKAPYVQKSPQGGLAPKHVLMTAGYRDGYFAPGSQAAMAVALGIPIGGASVEETVNHRLHLAGIDPAPFPLKANLASGATGGILAYEAPFTLGHYIAFDVDEAIYQYTCFFATLGPDGPPTFPGRAPVDASCPE